MESVPVILLTFCDYFQHQIDCRKENIHRSVSGPLSAIFAIFAKNGLKALWGVAFAFRTKDRRGCDLCDLSQKKRPSL